MKDRMAASYSGPEETYFDVNMLVFRYLRSIEGPTVIRLAVIVYIERDAAGLVSVHYPGIEEQPNTNHHLLIPNILIRVNRRTIQGDHNLNIIRLVCDHILLPGSRGMEKLKTEPKKSVMAHPKAVTLATSPKRAIHSHTPMA